MQRRGCVCMLLLAACANAVALSGSPEGLSAPLIAWSSHQLLSEGQEHARAVYEVASTLDSVKDVVLGAVGKSSPNGDSKRTELVVVYVGSQVDASILRRAARTQVPLQQLSTLLETAGSSVIMPFLRHQGSLLQEGLQAQLQQLGLSYQAVGCFGTAAADSAQQARQVLESSPDLQVLLVCATAASNSPAADALQVEMEQLAAVHAVVEASGRPAVHLYTSQLSNNTPGRRSLQAASNTTKPLTGFGPYTNCGPLCQTQVRWLEGLLAVLFMAFATCAGMACLYMLNTPSRFENAKDSTSS